MIGLETAREFLDFRGETRSITEEAAEEQLRGAVAVHNILEQKGVAYLADEVGMGKTYVALGALALFRHFQPDFRLLVIAPRENIQRKWMKEYRNFVRNNVRFADLRVKAVHGAPARQSVTCHNLVELVRETSLNPDRDFFARLTSFSLPLGKDVKAWRKRRDELLRYVPWVDRSAFDLRNRSKFKDSFARAVCSALPPFDLVIVDEGHNLKHGFGEQVASRNRVLALAFGHPSQRVQRFHGYRPRKRKVLFLSATPLESDYAQLWNQLDVFGLGHEVAPELVDDECSEEEKRTCAQSFLIRRVTSITVGEKRLTKNLYRREWRLGGCESHDDPLDLGGEDGDRQRLIVALVQKKVSEVLGHEKFNNSFQIGMLASFESFLETAKVKKRGEDEVEPTFDDADQTGDENERLGIDVGAVNKLASSYRKRFGKELPHPKMDALVGQLAAGLPAGRKALVFVRRVASVKELQAKLEERYDEALFGRLRDELPGLAAELERLFEQYRQERMVRRRRTGETAGDAGELEEEGAPAQAVSETPDTGGLDSFFAWFFRGEGPPGVLSGAALQRRFLQSSAAYSTFFEDNYLSWLLAVRPDGSGSVLRALAGYLQKTPEAVAEDLVSEAEKFLPARRDRTVGRLHLFLAIQEAALTILGRNPGSLQERARTVLQALQSVFGGGKRGARAPAGSERWLEEPTFFTELRERPALRARIWPEPKWASDLRGGGLRERALRRLFLSATARLGHAFIDLYVLALGRIGSLQMRARESEESAGRGLIGAYLDHLEQQLETERAAVGIETAGNENGAAAEPEFRAFRELALVSEHYRLIMDVNVPDLRTLPLSDAARTLGTLFGRQQPIGGMFGAINQTLVRQFRLPGYPFVLISTDLLQEGEDLHTFCSAVYHYGISWMPSSMEQRVGRVDRVNSETQRRLTALVDGPDGGDKLQVYYPHLRDTVEVLQVRRVLERIDRFIRLMHKDLRQPSAGERQLRVDDEIHRTLRLLEPIREPLTTAFPVREELLQARNRPLAVKPEATAGVSKRFRAFRRLPFERLKITWEDHTPGDELIGTVWRDGRQQPFRLLLRSLGGRLMLRCVSPVGRGEWEIDFAELGEAAFHLPVQLVVDYDDRHQTSVLSTEDEMLLAGPEHDLERVGWLIHRVTSAADQLEEEFLEGQDQGLEPLREALEEDSSLDQ